MVCGAAAGDPVLWYRYQSTLLDPLKAVDNAPVFVEGGIMSGSTLIDAESAGADASLVEPGIEGTLDLLGPMTPSLDAVITSGAASPDSTLNEAEQDDYPQTGATPFEERAGAVPDPGIDSLANFAVDESVSVALAADITGLTPEGDGTEQASAGPAKVPDGQAGNDPVSVEAVEAAADAAAEAGSDESGEAAPAASMAMSVDTGASFDGTMGASLVYGDCRVEPVDGGDGGLDWTYTRPYITGDVTGDISYDIYPLPAEGDGGFKEEPGDWMYVEETDEWVDLGGDEDWIYLDEWEDPGYIDEGGEWVYADEGEDGIYLDEWEDPGYIDDGGEWVYADEGEDWIYLDEWEEWGYVEEGDEWMYADEGDGSDVSDPEVISPEGNADGAGYTFTASILPLAVNDLFIS